MNRNIEQFNRCVVILKNLQDVSNPAQLIVTVSSGKTSEGEQPDAVEIELGALADLSGIIDMLAAQVIEEKQRWVSRAQREELELKEFIDKHLSK